MSSRHVVARVVVSLVLGLGIAALGACPLDPAVGVLDDVPALSVVVTGLDGARARAARLRVTVELPGALAETELAPDDDGWRAVVPAVRDGTTGVVRALGATRATDALVVLAERDVVVVDGAVTAALDPGAGVRSTLDDGLFRFDVNGNGHSNLDDLVRGCPAVVVESFLGVGTTTIDFPSGLAVGAAAARALVVQNRGDLPIDVEVDVVGAQGTSLRVTPLDLAAPDPEAPAKRIAVPALAAGDERILRVDFVNAIDAFVRGAVAITATQRGDQSHPDCGNREARTVTVVANVDEPLRGPPTGLDVAPTLASAADFGAATFPTTAVVPYPPAALWSGTSVSSVPTPSVPAALLALPPEEATLGVDEEGRPLPADAVFLVELPAAAALDVLLDGLDADLDLRAHALLDGDVLVEAPLARSSTPGLSGEHLAVAAALDTQRLLLVVWRRDVLPLAVDPDARTLPPASFALSTHVFDGPQLTDVPSPSSGSVNGGDVVTLRGVGITAGARVFFGDAATAGATVAPCADDATRTCVAVVAPAGALPPDANPATVTLENPDGQRSSVIGGYTYLPGAPAITAVTPGGVLLSAVDDAADAPVAVTVDGAGFTDRFGLPEVRFGADLAPLVIVESPSRLVATVPLQSAAVILDVTVANRRLGEELVATTRDDAFAIWDVAPPPPVVTQVVPPTGTLAGYALVTVLGQDFKETPRVWFRDVEAPSVSFLDDGTLLVVTPPLTAFGDVAITVVNPDGATATVSGLYGIPDPTGCGNGTVDDGEACDPFAALSLGCTDVDPGFTGGTLGCTFSCTFNTTQCSTCGNGIVDGSRGEQCDGVNLGELACADLGFSAGVLSCRADCTTDVTLCTRCDGAQLDPGEVCDGTLFAPSSVCPADGAIACSSSCALDYTGCFDCADPVCSPAELVPGACPGGSACDTLPSCGDDTCDMGAGESCATCPGDCPCVDPEIVLVIGLPGPIPIASRLTPDLAFALVVGGAPLPGIPVSITVDPGSRATLASPVTDAAGLISIATLDSGLDPGPHTLRVEAFLPDGLGTVVTYDYGLTYTDLADNEVVVLVPAGPVTDLGPTALFDANVNDVRDLVFGPDGWLYFSDVGYQRILRVDPVGNRVEHVAGTAGTAGLAGDDVIAADAPVYYPSGLVFIGDQLFFADSGNCVIRRIDTSASPPTMHRVAGIAGCSGGFAVPDDGAPVGAAFANFGSPFKLAVDATSTTPVIFFTATDVPLSGFHARLYRLDDPMGATPTVSFVFDTGPTCGDTALGGVVVDPLGRVWFGYDPSQYTVSCLGVPGSGGHIVRIEPDGALTTVLGGGTVALAGGTAHALDVLQSTSPLELVLDDDGTAYFVSDAILYRMDTAGRVAVIATPTGSALEHELLSETYVYPRGLALDDDHNLYFWSLYMGIVMVRHVDRAPLVPELTLVGGPQSDVRHARLDPPAQPPFTVRIVDDLGAPIPGINIVARATSPGATVASSILKTGLDGTVAFTGALGYARGPQDFVFTMPSSSLDLTVVATVDATEPVPGEIVRLTGTAVGHGSLIDGGAVTDGILIDLHPVYVAEDDALFLIRDGIWEVWRTAPDGIANLVRPGGAGMYLGGEGAPLDVVGVNWMMSPFADSGYVYFGDALAAGAPNVVRRFDALDPDLTTERVLGGGAIDQCSTLGSTGCTPSSVHLSAVGDIAVRGDFGTGGPGGLFVFGSTGNTGFTGVARIFQMTNGLVRVLDIPMGSCTSASGLAVTAFLGGLAMDESGRLLFAASVTNGSQALADRCVVEDGRYVIRRNGPGSYEVVGEGFRASPLSSTQAASTSGQYYADGLMWTLGTGRVVPIGVPTNSLSGVAPPLRSHDPDLVIGWVPEVSGGPTGTILLGHWADEAVFSVGASGPLPYITPPPPPSLALTFDDADDLGGTYAERTGNWAVGVVGDPPACPFGSVVGQARDFTHEATDYLDVTALVPGADPGLGNATISMWVYLRDTGTTVRPLIGRCGPGTANLGDNCMWTAQVNDRTPREFHEYNAGIDRVAVSPTELPSERWVHVAVVHDVGVGGGTVTSFYRNGVHVGTASTGADPEGGTASYVRVGNWPRAITSHDAVDGCIDELYVWNSKLTPAQVNEVYLAGRNGQEWEWP